MKPLFRIKFTDESEFIGGDLMNTKWKKIPDKYIVEIFYLLPNGKYLNLSGFKRIYQFIEATNDLNGVNAGKVNIEFSYLLIEKNNKIIQYKINRKTGNVDIRYFNINDDYIMKLNPNYWKRGSNV